MMVPQSLLPNQVQGVLSQVVVRVRSIGIVPVKDVRVDTVGFAGE